VAVARHGNFVTPLAKRSLEHPPRNQVVVGNQDFHARTLGCRALSKRNTRKWLLPNVPLAGKSSLLLRAPGVLVCERRLTANHHAQALVLRVELARPELIDGV